MINKINMGKVFAKVIGQVSPIELYTKELQKSRPLMVNRQNADWGPIVYIERVVSLVRQISLGNLFAQICILTP